MSFTFPVELDADYPCKGTDANGKRLVFDDLLFEGQRVGQTVPNVPDNVFPPTGTVVRRDDGTLWVEADES